MPLDLTQRYIRCYTSLGWLGHTPAKAYEILLDCKRRDLYALTWLRMAVRLRRNDRARRRKHYGI